MKMSALLKGVCGAGLLGLLTLGGTGCANQSAFTDTDWVPGMSLQEDSATVARYMHYDAEQLNDDWDRDVVMDRPESHMTWWDNAHSD